MNKVERTLPKISEVVPKQWNALDRQALSYFKKQITKEVNGFQPSVDPYGFDVKVQPNHKGKEDVTQQWFSALKPVLAVDHRIAYLLKHLPGLEKYGKLYEYKNNLYYVFSYHKSYGALERAFEGNANTEEHCLPGKLKSENLRLWHHAETIIDAISDENETRDVVGVDKKQYKAIVDSATAALKDLGQFACGPAWGVSDRTYAFWTGTHRLYPLWVLQVDAFVAAKADTLFGKAVGIRNRCASLEAGIRYLTSKAVAMEQEMGTMHPNYIPKNHDQNRPESPRKLKYIDIEYAVNGRQRNNILNTCEACIQTEDVTILQYGVSILQQNHSNTKRNDNFKKQEQSWFLPIGDNLITGDDLGNDDADKLGMGHPKVNLEDHRSTLDNRVPKRKFPGLGQDASHGESESSRGQLRDIKRPKGKIVLNTQELAPQYDKLTTSTTICKNKFGYPFRREMTQITLLPEDFEKLGRKAVSHAYDILDLAYNLLCTGGRHQHRQFIVRGTQDQFNNICGLKAIMELTRDTKMIDKILADDAFSGAVLHAAVEMPRMSKDGQWVKEARTQALCKDQIGSKRILDAHHGVLHWYGVEEALQQGNQERVIEDELLETFNNDEFEFV